MVLRAHHLAPPEAQGWRQDILQEGRCETALVEVHVEVHISMAGLTGLASNLGVGSSSDPKVLVEQPVVVTVEAYFQPKGPPPAEGPALIQWLNRLTVPIPRRLVQP